MSCNRGLHVHLQESNMEDLQPGLDQKLPLCWCQMAVGSRFMVSHLTGGVRAEWTKSDWCMKISMETSHEGWKTLWTNAYYLWDVPSEHEGPSWLKTVYFHLHNHAADLSCGRDTCFFLSLRSRKAESSCEQLEWGNNILCMDYSELADVIGDCVACRPVSLPRDKIPFVGKSK